MLDSCLRGTKHSWVSQIVQIDIIPHVDISRSIRYPLTETKVCLMRINDVLA